MEDLPRAPPRADDPVVWTNLQPAEGESSPAHRNWGKEIELAVKVGGEPSDFHHRSRNVFTSFPSQYTFKITQISFLPT